jgi:hypothetical protein
MVRPFFFFFFGCLGPAVKLMAISGLPWMKAKGAMSLASFLVIGAMVLLNQIRSSQKYGSITIRSRAASLAKRNDRIDPSVLKLAILVHSGIFGTGCFWAGFIHQTLLFSFWGSLLAASWAFSLIANEPNHFSRWVHSNYFNSIVRIYTTPIYVMTFVFSFIFLGLFIVILEDARFLLDIGRVRYSFHNFGQRYFC